MADPSSEILNKHSHHITSANQIAQIRHMTFNKHPVLQRCQKSGSSVTHFPRHMVQSTNQHPAHLITSQSNSSSICHISAQSHDGIEPIRVIFPSPCDCALHQVVLCFFAAAASQDDVIESADAVQPLAQGLADAGVSHMTGELAEAGVERRLERQERGV